MLLDANQSPIDKVLLTGDVFCRSFILSLGSSASDADVISALLADFMRSMYTRIGQIHCSGLCQQYTSELHYESLCVKEVDEEDVSINPPVHHLPRRVTVGQYFSDYLFEGDTAADARQAYATVMDAADEGVCTFWPI